MEILTLEKAVRVHKQDALAELLGVTQGAVQQANCKNRNIFIMQDGKDYTAFEIKPAFRTKPNIDDVSQLIGSGLQLEEA
jgi:hypothetical protein